MIKDLKFEFDLDDIKVDTRFLSELRKITDHYDTRTSAEEVKAVKLLIEKIKVVNADRQMRGAAWLNCCRIGHRA